MQNLEWYLADLKSTGKNTIKTVEKSLTDMFIRLVRIYPCLGGPRVVVSWCYVMPFTSEFGVRFPVSAVSKKQKCFFPIHV